VTGFRGARTVGVLAAAILAAGCGGRAGVEGIVLVTLDTTRADRLGCYGYAAAETPVLDRLAGSGTRFDRASSPVPVTLPAHASMFTGRYPPVHGVRYNGMFTLPEGETTIAERLRDAGWATAAFPAAVPVSGATGIAQGFELYDDPFVGPQADPDLEERRADDVSDRAIAWLNERREDRRPWFLWVHYYDPHVPYEPPFPFGARFRERPYDGEIAFVDQQLGRVLEELRSQGLDRRTAVIVVGDHGEGLYDHGERLHSQLVYESTLHVPLIVAGPGVARGRVEGEPVSIVDVGATILRLAGVESGGGMDGVDLLDRLARRDLYFESLAGSLSFGWSPLEGIRRGSWKYIRSSDPELYDLEADPGETTNLHATDPERVRDLEEALEDRMASWSAAASAAASNPTPMDEATLARLASLGYVGGSVSETRTGGSAPKRFIHLETAILGAQGLMIDGDFEAALPVLDQILADDPTNRLALHQRSYALVRLERYPDALATIERLTAAYPEFAPGWILAGEVFVRQGDFASAQRAFEAGIEHADEDAAMRYRAALAVFAQGNANEALTLLEQESRAAGADASLWVTMAACRARLGDPDGALRDLRTAVAKGYRDVEVLRAEPLLAPLRGVPGFGSVVAEMGTL